MTDLDPDDAEIWFGVDLDEIEPTITLNFQYPETGRRAHVTATRDQAYWIAERLITAIGTLDARNAERADLDTLFSLQAESPRNDRTDQP